MKLAIRSIVPVATLFCVATGAYAQQIVHVPLAYRAPRDGVTTKPNFSPKGTQVSLTPVSSSFALPAGEARPAKTGVVKVGPDRHSWVNILATSSSEHPSDLTRLYIDRNRNGNFGDDGPAIVGASKQNAKTKAWWTSIDKIELYVPYGSRSHTQAYLVSFWMVRDDSAPAPDVMRYSVGSWRYGAATVNGVDALFSAMDGDNNALFTKGDWWSVMPAAEPKAAQNVLSSNEARETNRLMFLPLSSGVGGKEQVLQFKSFSPDGSSVDFVVLDRPVTKAQDRAPDDMVRDERGRPRTAMPVAWLHGSSGLDAAILKARSSGSKILIDFEATWCGPCHTMDEWIWSDADVASLLNSGYVGVKVDVDLEKGLVSRFKTTGYPTMVILDSSGTEIKRHMEYMGSKEILGWLK